MRVSSSSSSHAFLTYITGHIVTRQYDRTQFEAKAQKLEEWIMDLGKGAFGMWAFIAHGGLSKPTVGFLKYGGRFSEKKKRLRQRRGPFRASRNMGAIFLKKKSACGNVVGHPGLPERWGPFFSEKIANDGL